MTEELCIGAWLPNEWGQYLTAEEKTQIAESEIDLLLIPENHDQWSNRNNWKAVADELDVAIYAGFSDGDWIRAIFYDPGSDTDFTYTKHSSAGKLDLERDDWRPEEALKTTDLSGTTIGTTICHDHYFAPFMGYEGLAGASLLVNLSATPVKRKKWGEVLQARAIENCAYVTCTMHGTQEDGTTKRGNHAHVFAFDPFGEPLTLTELNTNESRAVFDTSPDNIYTFHVDSSRIREARRTLKDQSSRPAITRIQESTSESATVGEPRISVEVDSNRLRIAYDGEVVDISEFESQPFTLSNEDLYLAALDSYDVLHPESIYRDVLKVDDIEDRRLLLVNHWSSLNSGYHRNVIEPVLRARCVEWACPAIVVAPGIEAGYQSWYAKNTSRMIPDENDRFQLYLYAARGVSSTFEPVNFEFARMQELASVCHTLHAEGD